VRHGDLSPRQAHELDRFVDVVNVDRAIPLEAAIQVVDLARFLCGNQRLVNAALGPPIAPPRYRSRTASTNSSRVAMLNLLIKPPIPVRWEHF
jgi:hypothetical protein